MITDIAMTIMMLTFNKVVVNVLRQWRWYYGGGVEDPGEYVYWDEVGFMFSLALRVVQRHTPGFTGTAGTMSSQVSHT